MNEDGRQGLFGQVVSRLPVWTLGMHDYTLLPSHRQVLLDRAAEVSDGRSRGETLARDNALPGKRQGNIGPCVIQ